MCVCACAMAWYIDISYIAVRMVTGLDVTALDAFGEYTYSYNSTYQYDSRLHFLSVYITQYLLVEALFCFSYCCFLFSLFSLSFFSPLSPFMTAIWMDRDFHLWHTQIHRIEAVTDRRFLMDYLDLNESN